MRPLELLVLYALIGLGVALAFGRSGRAPSLVVGAFWPLFVPALAASAEATQEVSPPDALGRLRVALSGWEVLPDGANAALAAAERGLSTLTRRLDEVDTLLRHADPDLEAARRACAAAEGPDRMLWEARVRSLERLHSLRDEVALERARALTAIEELTTRVHLARLHGESTVDVARQLADLAAAIDGAGEVRRLGTVRVAAIE